MSQLDQHVSDEFHAWELRGRGWTVFPLPVYPEPPFRPVSYSYPPLETLDDGRRPTRLSSILQRLTGNVPHPVVKEPPVVEPEPQVLIREPLMELRTALPAKLDVSREVFAHFLTNLSLSHEPITFEVIGTSEGVNIQFAVHPDDATQTRRQLQAHFHEAVFQVAQGTLEKSWLECTGEESIVVEFGLAREFMVPLAKGKIDPLIGIVAALTEMSADELALIQILFEPTTEPWADNMRAACLSFDGKPIFVNVPEIARAAESKALEPLFATVVRIAAKSATFPRMLQMCRDLAGSFRVFANPQSNELIPLANDEYPFGEHIEDLLRRQSRRSGMLLTIDELMGFVHLPSSAVRSPALLRDSGKTKAAPSTLTGSEGVLIGNNTHLGKTQEVRLNVDQRVRHMHLIGASGTGKSTLLFNLINQDVQNGNGVAVLDPHGDLIDRVLGIIPPERINDVILIDPSDEQFSVGFNILSAHSDLERNLLASDLVSIFQRLSTSWGDQMGSVLRNAIMAFLESSEGGTLLDLRRFLLEPGFRERFLKTVRDPEIVYYWQKAFTQLSGNKSIGPVLTRLDTFLGPKPLRYMVAQTVNRLDFKDILDQGKIFLAKLSEGQIGKENSYLLGSLLVAKFQQMVMGRQAQRVDNRRPYFLYIDEFQSFITPSMAEILSGARKYRLGLTLAHQELHHLDRNLDVKSALFSNAYTRAVFRVSDADSRVLENGFSFFTASDLQNLETGQAICRIEKSDHDFNLEVPCPAPEDVATTECRRQEVISASRSKYGTPRSSIEAALLRTAAAAEEHKPKEREKASTGTAPISTRLPPSAVPKSFATEVPSSLIPSPPINEPPITAPQPKARVARETIAPVDMGRGGEEHRAIQKRIKTAADKIGFKSSIEGSILDGKSADILLERSDLTIVCEISLTTPIRDDAEKIIKCLNAGFQTVAVICLEDERVKKIASIITRSIEPVVAKRVLYCLPDQFIAYLETLKSCPTQESGAIIRRGYKVKRSASKSSPEDQRQKERDAIQAIAETMKQNRKS